MIYDILQQVEESCAIRLRLNLHRWNDPKQTCGWASLTWASKDPQLTF